jgi:LuxR family transcriptional regulator, maltose regulon positive regulatory protein
MRGLMRAAAPGLLEGEREMAVVESEFLARISRRQRAFLTRTAVLERMCGPLCDAVLELSGPAGVLEDLARSNLLLVPLDRRQEWYRYHRLFRDMLLAELHRLEPDLMPVLYRRAAAWHERHGAAGEALEYLMKAGDAGAAARLAGVLAFPAYQHGRVATVERWFGWLDDHGAMEDHAAVAVMAAMVPAMTGKPAEAERWAKLAERAARTMAAGSFWRAAATLFLGMAYLMAGDPERADVLFENQVTEVRAVGGMIGACIALAERSLLAITREAWDLAGQFLAEAQSVARQANLADYPPVAIMHAVAAQLALHEADPPRARAELTQAQRLRPALTYAVPHLAVQARIELARCHLALADFTAARTLLREADEILTRRPRLGVFVQQAKDLRAEHSPARDTSAPGASTLTAAELRLLPMLSTHLSFPEIAEEMFLSRNTIRSQVYSIYRKLGASSRNQAVTLSRELGLLDDDHRTYHPTGPGRWRKCPGLPLRPDRASN